jgi:hypothetical protein
MAGSVPCRGFDLVSADFWHDPYALCTFLYVLERKMHKDHLGGLIHHFSYCIWQGMSGCQVIAKGWRLHVYDRCIRIASASPQRLDTSPLVLHLDVADRGVRSKIIGCCLRCHVEVRISQIMKSDIPVGWCLSVSCQEIDTPTIHVPVMRTIGNDRNTVLPRAPDPRPHIGHQTGTGCPS